MKTEIKKLYLKINEVAEITGLPIHRIQLAASRLKISKYINGNYKFQEKHIPKIIDCAAKIHHGGKRKIPKIKLQAQEVKRVRRKLDFLSKYVSEELKSLDKRLLKALTIESK